MLSEEDKKYTKFEARRFVSPVGVHLMLIKYQPKEEGYLINLLDNAGIRTGKHIDDLR